MKFRLIFLFALVAFITSISSHLVAQQGEPKLVVFIIVDQMRYDFFDRFNEHFTGGLKRIWNEGVVYSNAHHSHVPTNTAPGHAVIATGKYPGKNGIVNNVFYDRVARKQVSPFDDPRTNIIGVENNGQLPGRSPINLKSGTIGDWLKRKNSGSRVYSVARKDRAAILLGGLKADMAFWMDDFSTAFVTSTYYKKPYPEWASGFTGKAMLAEDINEGWNKKLPEHAYDSLRPDDFEFEKGFFLADFPHNKSRMRPGLPKSTKDLLMITATPFGDKFILDFSREIVINEKLGKGPATDMLLISCSAADAIGHHFGPESHEVMDYYLYLDEYLGNFLDFLDDEIGEDKYWVVLTSDHGAQAMPEGLALRGIDARRVLYTDIAGLIDSIEERVMDKFGLTDIVIDDLLSGVYLNFGEIDAKGLSRKKVRKALVDEIKGLDFISDAYTVDDFNSKEERPYLELYKKSYVNMLSPDIMVRPKENVLVHGPIGTGHGSPYVYDTHVPIIFSIPGLQHAVYDRKVLTVDIAPTIASMLGVKADKKVDGQILTEIVLPAID
jgi:predicted AlkP superfamily pyrophosphatase or phosphodiesterase